MGLFAESLQHAEAALDCNPSHGLALHHKSEALLWMGDNEQALAVLRSIPRSVHPELVNARIAWGLSRLGKQDEAWSHLKRALQESPDDPSGLLTAVEALFLSDSLPAETERLAAQASLRGGFNPSHHTALFMGCALGRIFEVALFPDGKGEIRGVGGSLMKRR